MFDFFKKSEIDIDQNDPNSWMDREADRLQDKADVLSRKYHRLVATAEDRTGEARVELILEACEVSKQISGLIGQIQRLRNRT